MKQLIASSARGNTTIVSLKEYKCSTIEPKSEFYTMDVGNTRYFNQLKRKQRPLSMSVLNSLVTL